MKKQALIITAALLTLCIAGCSQNGAKTTTAVTEAPAAAASAATTTTTTTAPETTASATELTLPDERLFKGYVESEKTEYLLSAADENSEKIAELTYGTMLEIYSCNEEGWYIAQLGGEQIGYVKADVIKEMAHTYPFGDRLFGGYVKTDEAIGLMSEPDENSEAIRQIPSGTQLDIYESEAEGWYMTAIANVDADAYDVGYVKAEYIAAIPSYDMDGNYEPTINDIAGRWIYEQQDAAYTEEYRGMPVGLYTISEDGRFTYTTDNSSFTYGTVKVTYEEFENGQRVPWFSFYDDKGELFMACAATSPSERTDGCLYIGQDGIERLVPDYGNAIGGTDNYSVPNEYGFYEFKNPPASGVSIAALSGTWKNADKPAETLVITNGEDIYNGNFTFTDESGASTSGYIKLEFLLNPDDTKSFWYTFYKNDGKFWNGFSVSGDIPLEDLYSGQDGALHLVRQN